VRFSKNPLTSSSRASWAMRGNTIGRCDSDHRPANALPRGRC